MFGIGKKNNQDTSASEDAQVADTEPSVPSVGKGAPTPKRKEQEAARKRPLVPNDRKAASRAAREAAAEQRARTRDALETGDDRYLPPKDKGPQRRLARDIVDARWSVGELLLPLAILILLLSLFRGSVTEVIMLVCMYALIVGVVLDSLILGRKIRRKAASQFGQNNVEQGLAWYGVMRAIQIRRLRLPKPQVKRGEHP